MFGIGGIDDFQRHVPVGCGLQADGNLLRAGAVGLCVFLRIGQSFRRQKRQRHRLIGIDIDLIEIACDLDIPIAMLGGDGHLIDKLVEKLAHIHMAQIRRAVKLAVDCRKTSDAVLQPSQDALGFIRLALTDLHVHDRRDGSQVVFDPVVHLFEKDGFSRSVFSSCASSWRIESDI